MLAQHEQRGMPWKLKRAGDRWQVCGGKKNRCYRPMTKAKAERFQRAMYAFAMEMRKRSE